MFNLVYEWLDRVMIFMMTFFIIIFRGRMNDAIFDYINCDIITFLLIFMSVSATITLLLASEAMNAHLIICISILLILLTIIP